MVLMALDHVRAFFHYGALSSDPLDLQTTTGPLFFTRWITHFVAPAFVFLAGTSAYLYGQRVGEKKKVSTVLLTRGLWLVRARVLRPSSGAPFTSALSESGRLSSSSPRVVMEVGNPLSPKR